MSGSTTCAARPPFSSLPGTSSTTRLPSGSPVARRAGDRPALCDFILPAIVDRDDVVVAISTGGASPTLAAALRGRIEAVLPERIGELARLAGTFRAQVNALIVDPPPPRGFWRRLVEGPAARLVLAGDDAGAARWASSTTPVGWRPWASPIVGAGGRSRSLTLKAAQLLREADAILHDDLVPPAVLARARRDAELVAVGKRKGQVRWTQDEINASWSAACAPARRWCG